MKRPFSIFVALLALAGCALGEAEVQQAGDSPPAAVVEPPSLPADLPPPNRRWVYFNRVSGVRQEQHPGGGVPYIHPESGEQFWIDGTGQWKGGRQQDWAYSWVELFAEDSQRPYFYNQETKFTSWDRPVDLGWIMLPAEDGGSGVVGAVDGTDVSSTTATSTSSSGGDAAAAADASSSDSGSTEAAAEGGSHAAATAGEPAAAAAAGEGGGSGGATDGGGHAAAGDDAPA